MKCIRCKAEIKDYENDRFCRKCGYPVVKDTNMETFPLKTVFFDAEVTRTLYVNGRRIDRLLGFELKFKDGECSLLISADEEYKIKF